MSRNVLTTSHYFSLSRHVGVAAMSAENFKRKFCDTEFVEIELLKLFLYLRLTRQ